MGGSGRVFSGVKLLTVVPMEPVETGLRAVTDGCKGSIVSYGSLGDFLCTAISVNVVSQQRSVQSVQYACAFERDQCKKLLSLKHSVRAT